MTNNNNKELLKGICIVSVLIACTTGVTHGQYYGRNIPCATSYMDPDGDCLAGIGGKDYPMLSSVPRTSFQCNRHPVKILGYFADIETRCQVFHVCMSDGRQDTFLCPNGTLFNQQFLVCDWWFNVKCSDAPKLYTINEYLHAPVTLKQQQGLLSPNVRPIPAAKLPQDTNPSKGTSSLWKTLLSSLIAPSQSSTSESMKSSSSPQGLSSFVPALTPDQSGLPPSRPNDLSGTPFSAVLSNAGSSGNLDASSSSSSSSWSVPISAVMSYPVQSKESQYVVGQEEVIHSHATDLLQPQDIRNVPVLPRTKNHTADSVKLHFGQQKEDVSRRTTTSEDTGKMAAASSKNIIGTPRNS